MSSRILASFAVLGLGVASLAAAPPRPQVSTSATGAGAGLRLDAVLYDQNNNLGTQATNSQRFEPANAAFDNELADDFIVPAGGWSVTQVSVPGVYFNGPGPMASANVVFYNDASNLPGTSVAGCIYPSNAVVDTAGSLVINLAPACVLLTPGHYWVGVQASMNFTPAGQWGWTDRTVTSNSPAAWRNPGGGFGTPCTAFGVRGATCGIDAPAPDQAFALGGTPAPVELQDYTID